MSLQWQYGKLSQSADIETLGKILDRCFIALSGTEETFIHRIGVERCRILRRNEQIIGGLAIIPLGQWWGNACVEMGGIAAVGIEPEFRGQGAARVLMQSAVQDMYAAGMAISVLFPATQYLYRQIGYEQAGVGCVWEIDCKDIHIYDQPLPLTRMSTDNLEIFKQLYQQQNQYRNGYVQRDRFLWDNKIRSQEQSVYAYLLGDKEQPQGYIIYTQDSSADQNILRVRDWVLLNPQAIRSFWGFLAKMRSQIDQVRWVDGGITGLTWELPEQHERLSDASRWMLRVVNLVKALEQRGYPPHLDTELHLQIEDDLVPENNGNFILKISSGQGYVQTGGNPELKLDIRSLAPLYTGLFTPQQLQNLSKITATPTAIAIATQIFAGSLPSIGDYF